MKKKTFWRRRRPQIATTLGALVRKLILEKLSSQARPDQSRLSCVGLCRNRKWHQCLPTRGDASLIAALNFTRAACRRRIITSLIRLNNT